MVSAGNTGAFMATVKIVCGALPGVDRPALAGIFPTSRGTMAIMVDVGANVDCKPQNLEQFAQQREYWELESNNNFETSIASTLQAHFTAPH